MASISVYLLLSVAAFVLTLCAGEGLPLIATRGAPETWPLGALVHADLGHLLRDVLGFAALGCLYGGRVRQPALFLLVIIAVPTIACFLWYPHMNRFFGLSGATHALFAVALVMESSRRDLLWWCVAIGFVTKLGYEAITGHLVAPLSSGITPAIAAHVVGAALGAVWALSGDGVSTAVEQRPQGRPICLDGGA